MKRLICLLLALVLPVLFLRGAFSESFQETVPEAPPEYTPEPTPEPTPQPTPVPTRVPDWFIPPKEPVRVFFDDETDPFPADAELLTLYVFPIQGADCMLLTYKGHTMLVDAGRPTQAEEVQGTLKSLGLSSVDYLFSTHPHSDHIGGVVPLIDSGFGIGTFFTVFPHDYVENYNAYDYYGETLRALDKAKIPVKDLKTEDKIPFGGADITVMRIPDNYLYEGLTCNEMAAMLMVKLGDCSMLLTADVEPSGDSQKLLARLYDLKADILKYPHHGMSIMAADFMREVDPEYSFFTHGAGNTRDAQALLIHNGFTRMSFATWGLITIQTDGTKWIVHQDIFPEMAEVAETYRYPD